MRIFKRLLLTLTGLMYIVSSEMRAQSALPRATLFGWEDHVRLFIFDRAHNAGGQYYDRGLFRMHTHDMDPEYQLDLFTYRFSYFDDYRWNRTDNGYRTFFGSLNTTDFAIQGWLKNRIQMGESGALSVEAVQHDDRRANRILFRLGYAHDLGEYHRLGISHTLSQQKTDIDATFFYRYGSGNRGFVTAEVTILDWFNNIVSDLALHRDSEYEIRHVYSKQPLLYAVRLESPVWSGLRGEAVAGIQSRSQATVNRRDFPDEDFVVKDWVNYQGVLLEVQAADIDITGGIIFQRTFARMERAPAPDSGYLLDYGNRQITLRGGAYVTWQRRGFGFEQWFWIERNRDEQFDNHPEAYIEQDPMVLRPVRYPFEMSELRKWNKTRIFYKPTGQRFMVYLEYNGDWRDFDYDRESDRRPALRYRSYYHNQLVSRNERLSLSLGYRFSPRFRVEVGASLDLDGDIVNGFDNERAEASVSRFDGGFVRIFLSW